MDRIAQTLMFVLVAFLAFLPERIHGYTWEAIGPRGGGAMGVAVDANGTTLYAISDDSPHFAASVHRSDDGGATWSDVKLAGNVVGIGSDPSTSGTVFAAIAEYTFCSTCYYVTLHILKTVDGGDTWSGVYSEELGSGVPLGQFEGYNQYGVAVDPSSPQNVHVGGYLRSVDGGTTWTQIPGPVSELAKMLVVDPTDSQVVYAIRGGSAAGILKSTDGGDTYVSAGANLGSFVPVGSIALDAANGDVYIAGTTVYRSVDGAASWMPTGASFPTGVRALAARDGVVWVGTGGIRPPNPPVVGSLFRSSDAGATWTERAAGIPRVPSVGSGVTMLALPPDSHGAWVATDNFGVYCTDSDGLEWRPPLNGMRRFPVQDVAIDPTAATTLYAGTTRGIFRSTDRGASWRPTVDGIPTLDVRSIALDPQTPATLYVIVGNAGTTSTAAFAKSTDAGATWTNKSGGTGISAVAIDPVTPSTVYLAHGTALAKSTNGADTWTVTFPPSFSARALIVDPTSPLTVYAGGFAYGINKSIDGGGSWTQSNAGLTDLNVSYVAMDLQDSLRLYAVIAGGGGVYTSDDGAAAWTATGPLAGTQHTAVVNPSTSGIYVGGNSGIFEASAGGAAWTPLGTGFPLTVVHRLGVDPGARALYAAGNTMFGSSGELERLQLVPCTTAADCDDANACTTDACDTMTGTCSNTALADGAPCTDGDTCTTDVCTGGACRSALDPCSVCADGADADGDGVSDACDANDGLVTIKSAKIVRNPANGSVTVKGNVVLGPGDDAITSSAGLALQVTAGGGFAATGTWSAADCKVNGTRFACASPDRRWRLKVRPTNATPTAPRFYAKLRGLPVAAVPPPPVSVEIDEVGAAIARIGAIGNCTAKTSALVCRAP